jgi:hypothetical protein
MIRMHRDKRRSDGREVTERDFQFRNTSKIYIGTVLAIKLHSISGMWDYVIGASEIVPLTAR